MNLLDLVDRVDNTAWRKFPTLVNLLRGPLAVISVFAFFFFDVLLLLSWPLLLGLIWNRFQSVQHYWWVRSITLLILVLLAYVLYVVRRDYRILYGAAETVIGIVACWTVLKNIGADRMTFIVALAASLYFIVRGIDNFQEGRKVSLT